MDETKLNELYDSLMSYKTYFKHKYPRLDEDEIESELNFSIAKAYKFYEEGKGVQFNTYVCHIMHNGCRTLLRTKRNRYKVYNAFSLDDTISDEDKEDWYGYYTLKVNEKMQDVEQARELIMFLEDYLSTLKRAQYRVLELYLKGYTTREIEHALNISHQSIHGTKQRIIDRLIKIPYFLELYPCINECKIVQTRFKERVKND